jgi:hypothetical protein
MNADIRYVYVFQDHLVTKYYKIGLTNDPDARKHKIEKGLPFKFLKIYGVIPTFDPETLEKKLHTQFAHKRRLNEWFELTDDDLKIIDAVILGSQQLITN